MIFSHFNMESIFTVHRFPSSVWHRLQHSVEPLLHSVVVSGTPLLCWWHPPVASHAAARYLKTQDFIRARCATLADCFQVRDKLNNYSLNTWIQHDFLQGTQSFWNRCINIASGIQRSSYCQIQIDPFSVRYCCPASSCQIQAFCYKRKKKLKQNCLQKIWVWSANMVLMVYVLKPNWSCNVSQKTTGLYLFKP